MSTRKLKKLGYPAILIAAVSAFGIILVFVFHDNAIAVVSSQSSTEIVNTNIHTNPNSPHISGPSANIGDFIQNGGKSVVQVIADTQQVSLSRGTTGRITLNLNHIAGQDPLPEIKIVDAKINNGYIPGYLAKLTTPEERAQAIMAGQTVPGAIDLNSLVTFSPKNLLLGPNENKQMYMDISLPKDWSDSMVGEDILFSIEVDPTPGYDYHEVLMKQTWVNVHVSS